MQFAISPSNQPIPKPSLYSGIISCTGIDYNY